jgi:phosphatidylserine/phosphatidylglycerophosphate/cardiolipin synthase-like enzyme
MGVHGIGPGRGIQSTDDVEAQGGAPAADAAPAPAQATPAAARAAGGPASRDDVQRALLAKSQAASATAAISGAGAAQGAGAAGENAKLRKTFDEINVPAGPAVTYRMDKNTDAFASRWKTLEGAKKSFDTTYFIWERDVFGYAYMGHMLKKAKEGVAIRGMIDATGDAFGMKGFKGTFRGQDYLQELVGVDPKRVQFAIFNPVLKKDPTSLAAIVSSNHDKLAIADGAVVETGGRNMAAHYYSDPKDHKGVYRDTDIHIESSVAGKSATKAFEAEFKDDNTEMVKPEMFGNWVKRDIELLGAYEMMDAWLKAPDLSDAEKDALRKGGPAAERAADALVKAAVAKLPESGIKREPSRSDLKFLKERALELVSNPELRGTYDNERKPMRTEVKFLDKVSATTVGENQISDNMIKLIDSAQESIYIHNPYVVLTDRALDALERAGKRGVEVIIGTNSPESSDSAITQAYFLEDWPMILARVPNSRIIVATGDQKHHSKTFVVDGTLTGISTFNADWISARVNSEDMALTWSKEFAEDTVRSYRAAIDDPEHGAVEYKIKRDAEGRALVKDGKPIVEFGPENHVPKETLEGMYKRLRPVANFMREKLDGLESLNHRPLDPAKDNIKIVK